MARFPRRSRDIAAFDAIAPDPDKVGGIAEAPFVRLPDPATVFAARARRLLELAPGNLLEPYLMFLGRIVEAQHVVQSALPSPHPSDGVGVVHGTSPLSSNLLREDPAFAATLQCLLDNVPVRDAPVEALEARSRLVELDAMERLVLAVGVVDAAYAVDRLGETLYIAAAVQVYFTRQAALLDATAVHAVADGVCPACGGAPVASLVVGWTQASKARYLCCSICSTLWNYVRIKCTSCGSTDGMSYYSIEDGSGNVAAETCTTCHSYLKHLHQHGDPLLEPFADDVASYGLDLMVREQEFRRSGINPLFVTG